MAVLRRTLDGVWAVAGSAPLHVWVARYTAVLLPQGIIAFLIHASTGFEANHADFPFGFQLDALHAVTHIAWGAAGAFFGFLRPRWAVPFLIAFGVYYVTLSFLGTFTSLHFGMVLGPRENIAHWTLGPLGLVVGLYGLWQENRKR